MVQHYSSAPGHSVLPERRQRPLARMLASIAAGTLAVALSACGAPDDTVDSSTDSTSGGAASETPQSEATAPQNDAAPEDDQASIDAGPANEAPAEDCDWDAPKITGSGEAPAGQAGELAEVIVGSWQHTHTDEGSGFEPVTNDHRYVFTSPTRMLYCQHVPGATDYAENAADIGLAGTTIELPGGAHSYTVTAWDQDTIVWDNPVGGGYLYLLQRR